MCRHLRWSSRRAARGLLTDRSGATAVEFALVFWPLALTLFGSLEVGRVLWTQTALAKTATTAARCIGIRNANCTRDGAYNEDLSVAFIRREARSWFVPLEASAITIRDASDCDGVPGQSQVILATTILSPVPFIAKMMAGSEEMRAKACFPTQAAS